MGRRHRWKGEIRPEWDWTRIWSVIAAIAIILALGFLNLASDERAERRCRRLYARAHTAVDSALVDREVFSRPGEPAWTCGMMHRWTPVDAR